MKIALFTVPLFALLSLFLLITAGLLTACSSTSLNTAIPNVPARIVAVNNSSKAELQRIVANALNLSKVLLAGDALTHGNVLIIEQKRLLGINTHSRKAINERAKPSVFRLVKSGDNCVLILQGTNKRWALKKTQCEPIKPPMTV